MQKYIWKWLLSLYGFPRTYSQKERIYLWSSIFHNRSPLLWEQTITQADRSEDTSISLPLMRIQDSSKQIINSKSSASKITQNPLCLHDIRIKWMLFWSWASAGHAVQHIGLDASRREDWIGSLWLLAAVQGSPPQKIVTEQGQVNGQIKKGQKENTIISNSNIHIKQRFRSDNSP